MKKSSKKLNLTKILFSHKNWPLKGRNKTTVFFVTENNTKNFEVEKCASAASGSKTNILWCVVKKIQQVFSSFKVLLKTTIFQHSHIPIK